MEKVRNLSGLLLFLVCSYSHSDIPIEVDENLSPPRPPAKVGIGGIEMPTSHYEIHNWIDLNYVPCKGLGSSGIGKVKAVIKVGRFDSATTHIESLSIITFYPRHDLSSASITYTDPSGAKQKIGLVRPWFATIGQSNLQHLVLPRVSTNKYGNSQNEGMTFKIQSGTSIIVKTVVMFPEFGSGCIGTSETAIMIEAPQN